MPDLLSQLIEGIAEKGDGEDSVYRLRDMIIRSVHLVDKGANRRRFVVVKRGEEMPNENLETGPEVKEDADGNLTTETDVEKGALAPPMKAAAMKAVGDAQGKLSALMDALKGNPDSMAVARDVSAVAKMLGDLLGKMEPSAGDSEKKDAKKSEDADEETTEEETSEEEAGDETEPDSFELDGVVFEGPLAALAKRGAKMKGDRLKRLKSALQTLKALVAELDGSDKNKAESLIGNAFGKLAKSVDGMTEKMEKQQDAFLAALADLLNNKVEKKDSEEETSEETTETETEPETIEDGQSDDGDPVAKSDTDDEDLMDESWVGFDLNDPEMHKDTADKDTSFWD